MTNKYLNVNKGVLTNQKESGETTYMSVKGNEQAKGLFEFLGENTNVEWGRVAYGNNSNYITTKNDYYACGAEQLAYEKLFKGGDAASVKSIDHSHTDGSRPSGFPGETGYVRKDEGDMIFAKWLYDYFPSNARNILLRVYNPLNQNYTKFDNKKILTK